MEEGGADERWLEFFKKKAGTGLRPLASLSKPASCEGDEAKKLTSEGWTHL